MLKTNKYSEEGFTVVEVLIAMVLLLMMVFTFTVLFTSSFDGIMTSGRRSEAVYASQQDVDSTATPESAISQTISVVFSGIDPIEVQGTHELYKKEYKDGREVVLDLFRPLN